MPSKIMEIVVSLAIVLVVILIIAAFVPGSMPDLIEKQQQHLKSPVLLTVVEDSIVTSFVGMDQTQYIYTVTIPARLIYPGGFEIDGVKRDEMDITAVIDFKGGSGKASVDDPVVYYNDDTVFKINKDEELDLTFTAIVKSSYPRPQWIGTSSYHDVLNNYESIVLKSENREFLITVHDIGTSSIVGRVAVIDIDCGESMAKIYLNDVYDEDKCDQKERYKCEKYIQACGNEIHLYVTDLVYDGARSERSVNLHIDLDSKNSDEYVVKDTVDVNFWVAEDRCVRTFETSDYLLRICGSKYYIGTESFETDLLT